VRTRICAPPRLAVSEAIAKQSRSYRDVLSRHPDQPKLWMSLAHLLKTVGDQAEA
jgi:hypothetical protein